HMIGNKCYLDEYEDYNGGFVSFGDGKGRISDKVPRKDNIYSIDLKSVVPTGGLTCLIAKATIDESNAWHKRLGHINFKTMNKRVKGNLVKDFMKPLWCPITILNTRDHLGKFDDKADEGYFVGYSVVSKAMRVFNKRTRIVKETLNIRFLENIPNVKGNGLDWLFDVDSLSISMNYVPVNAGNKTNGIAGTKDNIVIGQTQKEKEPEQEYILIPLCTTDPITSQGPKYCEGDAGMKPVRNFV
ncbi:ribonuclease H-like domain-containing protein, partial [Tanacetum coccineum]